MKEPEFIVSPKELKKNQKFVEFNDELDKIEDEQYKIKLAIILGLFWLVSIVIAFVI